MQTAAAYIRVSTEDQLEYSPESQLRKIRNYAEKSQIFLPEAYIFTDEGISGRHADNRPAFLSMIHTACCSSPPFQIILVWSFSRFARNREDSIFYKSKLKKYGVTVRSVSEPLKEDASSILLEALLEAMDEYYSVNLSKEVKRGMNEKFLNGQIVSAAPFGYRMEHGLCIPDPPSASIVQEIFQSCSDGSSPRQIAARLRKNQIKSRRGCAFQARTVRYILTNPFYIGKIRRHLTRDSYTVVNGIHTPIISEKLFYQVQHLLNPAIRST